MSNKIINFKLGMENKLMDAKEVVENVKLVEEGFKTINIQNAKIEISLSFSSYSKMPFTTLTPMLGFKFGALLF